ncbi:heme/hemin ABC transporter substrate-binding protein [Compostimonas suwonensis]|uniref:Iron complex transport system substrate-binding protein n=1 Tax=Compostimonas suwonensis TaxID=1048394 RepID=A0A2M9BVI0_9MICO|nr:ABC transporter substrate-binding protein [Compostimonas suwonensis]PJJ61967.1 iron complex transport system substrate-binding protein [Compostimonas suwonensis]
MNHARTPRLVVASALVAVAASILLSACSPQATQPEHTAANAGRQIPLGDLTVLDDPKSFVGPSTAVLQDAAVTPLVSDTAQTLPATVVSHDRDGDHPVTVADTSRVLGLDMSGSIAATIFGLGFGDSVVGRDVSTTFPGTEDLPLVTSGGHSVNAEGVVALKPSLVITDGTIGPLDVMLQLRDAGIDVVYVQNEPSIEGVGELARQVGAALGAPQAGEELAGTLQQQIDDKIAEIAAIVPTDPADRLRMVFLYLRGSSGIYYLFGEESGADVLIDALGGIDVAKEIGWDGMKPMTDEALVAADPDLILVMTDGLESAGGVDGLIETKPAIGITTAGVNKRFVDMADGDILSFGPRTPAVLDALARAIYAPQ